MSKKLWQITHQIEGLIPAQVKLKRKFWLKKGEILLKAGEGRIDAFVLKATEEDKFVTADDEILPYLKFSRFFSNGSVSLQGGGRQTIRSGDELGKENSYGISVISLRFPEEAVADVEQYASHYLREIRELHDKYIGVVNENEFLSTALDFFYSANNEPAYEHQSFINAVICLEALYNEGSSALSYKISHRASFILGLGGALDSIELFENLQKIYKVRSSLIHGEGALSNDSDIFEALRYARTSLMIFFVLLSNPERQCIGKHKRKKSILKEIDYAMLDVSKREALKKEISKRISDFSLKTPRTFERRGEDGEVEYRVTAW